MTENQVRSRAIAHVNGEAPEERVRRVFFHIGAPKTGTSYLQDLLFRNRRILERQGILYPSHRASDQFRAMLDLRGVSWHGYRDPWVPGSWDRVAHRSRAWPGTVVLSQESLAAATRQQARRAIESVQPAEVHIVYTVRDLGRLLASAWQQSVRTGGRRTFVDFVEQLEHSKRGASQRFWSHHDLPTVLRRWARDLPAGQVHVLPVAAADPPAQLWQRLASLLGVDPDVVASGTEHRHVSLGYPQAELLRRVNERLDGRLRYPLYGEIVSRWLAEDVLSRQGAPARFAVPEASFRWIRSLSEQYIDVVRTEGYQVEGDISSLLPDAPGAALSATDQPTVAAQLENSVEVIVEMLLAAARERQRPVVSLLQHTARAVRRGPRVSRWLADAVGRLR
jgi:hypothetical protein